MFRIDMRHILGHTREFWDFSTELTDLVELVVEADFYQVQCRRRETGMVIQYWRMVVHVRRPSLPWESAVDAELGFASDIELMLIYEGKGEYHRSESRFHELSFTRSLIQTFVKSIQARQEGIFHIDLQLRPYGKAGSLAVVLDAFQRYYAPDGPAWDYERQALVKLRPVTGDQGLCAEYLCLAGRICL